MRKNVICAYQYRVLLFEHVEIVEKMKNKKKHST